MPRNPRLPRATMLATCMAALLAAAPAAGAQNVAEGRAAFQSSNWAASATADRAVDGSTNGSYAAGSVAHTGFDLNAWWYVDLGDTYDISTITLFNRTDCCASRLNNFFVAIMAEGTESPGDIGAPTVWRWDFDGTAGPTELFTPGGMEGRYVKIQFDGRRDYLQLAEVQVTGVLSDGGTSVVPEPATVALLGTGLLALGGVGLRRRR